MASISAFSGWILETSVRFRRLNVRALVYGSACMSCFRRHVLISIIRLNFSSKFTHILFVVTSCTAQCTSLKFSFCLFDVMDWKASISMPENGNLANNEISPKHKSLINEIRHRLGHMFTDEFHTDFDILRWLQGHEFNLDLVVPKLRSHLRFRRAFDFKNYEWHPLMSEYYSFGYVGPTGRDNNHIFLDCTGKIDGEGVTRVIPLVDIILTTVCRMEKFVMPVMRKEEENTGKQSGFYLIMDIDGINDQSLSVILGLFKPFGLFLQHHYVEVFQKILIINAASYMYYIWRLMKPFMPERTQKKVMILSSDWKKELVQHVNAECLPVHWGGILTDENHDPMCRNRMIVPKRVPQNLYWKPGPDEPPKESLSQLTISCGKFEFVSIPVRENCAILRWYFFTDAEYSFGVYRAEKEEDFDTEIMHMVYPHISIIAASWRRPEIGRVKCENQGIYRLRFGNEHQWLSKLRIWYKVDVITDQ